MSTNPNLSPETMPADLQRLLSGLDAADQEARSLVESLDEKQLNWQPGGGTAWSVAQCLEHLAQANTLYIAALHTAVRQAGDNKRRQGPIRPGWFSRWFIRLLEPPPRRKIKAQKKVSPSGHWNGKEVLKAFLTAHDEVRAVIYEAQGLDLNRIRFTNPFIRLFHFTVGTGLMVIDAHDRRHLWQAQQVLSTIKAGGAR